MARMCQDFDYIVIRFFIRVHLVDEGYSWTAPVENQRAIMLERVIVTGSARFTPLVRKFALPRGTWS